MQAFLFIIFNRIELDESRINSRLHIDKYLLHILCITAIQVLRTKDWFRYDATHSSNTHVAKSIYLTNMSTALMDIDSINCRPILGKFIHRWEHRILEMLFLPQKTTKISVMLAKTDSNRNI